MRKTTASVPDLPAEPSHATYERQLLALQVELVKLQRHVIKDGQDLGAKKSLE